MALWRLVIVSEIINMGLQFLNQAFYLRNVRIIVTTYLTSLKHLWVEIVSLGHIEVRNDVLVRFINEHLPVERDVVEVLLLLLILEVVDYGQLWRRILEQNLNWDRRAQSAAHRHLSKVNVLHSGQQLGV